MPVQAVRWLRRMRGGAQSHLVEAGDGRCYVVKFKNNPQHRRILVNEWMGAHFARETGIAVPQVTLMRFTPDFIRENPECSFQLGSRQLPVEEGWHFASRYPGDPVQVAVFDFLPDVLLEKVVNRGDFIGALVLDKWLSNADARQSIFFRARLVPCDGRWGNDGGETGFAAWMIDHGYLFDGPQWTFTDAPLQGLYHRRLVYRMVRGWSDLEPWLQAVECIQERTVDQALKQIPPEWLSGDEDAFEAMLDRALERRWKVRQILDRLRQDERINLFPNWR